MIDYDYRSKRMRISDPEEVTFYLKLVSDAVKMIEVRRIERMSVEADQSNVAFLRCPMACN